MLSVVISTWNSMAFLPGCISSFLALRLDAQIIIVDCNSTDGSREYFKALRNQFGEDNDRLTIVWSPSKLSWSEANQIGLDLARGDWVCFSNPDVLFGDDFKRFYDYCRSSGEILVAAPQLVYPDGRIQPPAKTITPWLSLCIHTRLIGLILKALGKITPNYLFPYSPEMYYENGRVAVPNPQGSLFIVHRKVVEMLRGHLWHEGYMNGVSDLDAFLNFRKLGVSILLFPARKVIHYGGYASRKDRGWMEKDQAFGLVLYFRLHHLSNRLSPGLYSLIFGLEGIAEVVLNSIGRLVKPTNDFFNPRLSVWKTRQRIAGLIDGWRYRL